MGDGFGGGNPPVIRIVRKVKGGGHHGGAWKVAYADFVTALMAFFLVMWIVGLSQPVRQMVEAYFKDPSGFSKAVRDGKSPFAAGDAAGVLAGGATPIPNNAGKAVVAKVAQLGEVRKAIVEQMAKSPEFRAIRDSVDVRLTEEGLRIELMEVSSSLFFDPGSATIKERTRHLLAVIAQELRKVDSPVVIEGHTDSRPLAGHGSYTNWELSADRANAARRAMEESGLRARQIVAVRGYADRKPLRPNDPSASVNRRVSILVGYTKDAF